LQAAALGIAGRLRGEEREAIEELRRASTLAPGALVPVTLLGVTALEAREVDLATRELASAARFLPDCAPLIEKLAGAHYDQRRLDDAERLYRRALELDPDSPRLWERLARVHFRANETPAGLEAIERAYELSDGEAPHGVLLLYSLLLDRAEQPVREREILFEKMERFPERGTPWSTIGRTYDWEHDIVKAEEMYWKGVEAGDGAPSYMYLAHLYSGAKRDSCEDCRAFYDAHPEYVDPERAEECALKALELGGREGQGVTRTIVEVARRIGRRERVGAKLRELKDAAQTDELIVRFERALRELEAD
jgi:tetratricopeptide (TPR) repeat protein